MAGEKGCKFQDKYGISNMAFQFTTFVYLQILLRAEITN